MSRLRLSYPRQRIKKYNKIFYAKWITKVDTKNSKIVSPFFRQAWFFISDIMKDTANKDYQR